MKLLPVTHDGALYGFAFECPGCQDRHAIPTTGASAWGFNGDMDRPTFTPSILVRWRASDPSDPDALKCEETCHSYVTDGRIAFLNDCTHGLAGHTVDLAEVAT